MQYFTTAMSFLRKAAPATSQTVPAAANVLTQPPPISKWTFTGSDNVQRAFNPEHVAVLEAAYNRPQGAESVTSIQISGCNYIADFKRMQLRCASIPAAPRTSHTRTGRAAVLDIRQSLTTATQSSATRVSYLTSIHYLFMCLISKPRMHLQSLLSLLTTPPLLAGELQRELCE